ncbi:GroS Co-chaperonin GroES (HSP10) [uncultured Caudovirales phage]|jgi:co-chaperonin GroES (HSP10)|uniref:GroS Co-chaperonin GroES (HSP10) n=1 Tax=uncultured Caudovirales phage TaxID=2100421 RepID=A0A6J5KGQ5_9CAUD|nr:GroS Co-chaperonin GroES (HSP10) [uncultured Caudovirales phage]
MYNDFTPSNDNILVKINKPQEKTSGGIYLSAPVDNIPSGVVIEYSVKLMNQDDFTIKHGDTVLFKKFMGTVLDEEYIVLRYEDILGYFNKYSKSAIQEQSDSELKSIDEEMKKRGF